MIRLIFALLLLGSVQIHAQTRRDFILGGQIPFWIINGEVGTPSAAPGTNAARANIQPRADQMFDIVIPSALTWNWVEERRGTLDFHRFDWANNWAKANRKQILVQHLFWAWAEAKPRWFIRLNRQNMRQEVFRHIEGIHAHIGNVKRMTVVNEMMDQAYLTDTLGIEIIHEIFAQTRARFPRTQLFLNEHANPNDHRGANQIIATMSSYADFVNKMQHANIPFDHAGFQSYFTMQDVENLGGIERFVAEYNRSINLFTQRTGRPIFITELGFAAQDQTYRATFLRAFFTMLRDNPNVEGLIIFHWLDDQDEGTALVNRDGSLTPAGSVYYEVFGR